MHVAPRETGSFAVVALGASAGGLDACKKVLGSLPPDSGMAFILVQHHDGMMVSLLAGHTPMTVRQAMDGMPIERNNVYVIPPGAYLSVGNGVLHLSQLQPRHGAHLPFDFLLHSLAAAYGERAVCVVLSGTGADGSLGLEAVRQEGGFVIAQAPDDAAYDGMPQNAIKTGAVDLVLPAAKISEALANYAWLMIDAGAGRDSQPPGSTQDEVRQIIDLLRKRGGHDFAQYKEGTLRRRIARRMAMTTVGSHDIGAYLDVLRRDAGELDRLAKDLLINVTSFFHDPAVFDLLENKVVPDLVRSHTSDQPIRIWVAGCGTGEESYSIAMLFREKIAAANLNIPLQVFASDADSDAIARAREAIYPETIAREVSPARLARFFVKEELGYRITSELREIVVFAVQDVLTDPPFSRLDLIACRNLLNYLLPAAQAKVMAVLHFALREGGLLLLGGAEAIGHGDDRFEVIADSERLYRKTGRSRHGGFCVPMQAGDVQIASGALPRPGQRQGPARVAALAELCRRLVLRSYAPAAILINHKHECLYSLGPTDRYLRVAPGHSTHNLLAMSRPGLRTKLEAGIRQAIEKKVRIVVDGLRAHRNGDALSFSIVVEPVQNEGEDLLLVCFIDKPRHEHEQGRPIRPEEVSRVAELELELEVTRRELHDAIRNLEISTEAQLTSKEELQSLNEELTALDTQLQEMLERQRMTSNDLENVLYSTNVAALVLDMELKIRFFTPSTKLIFHVIPGDIGRPLADLASLAADNVLLTDARTVLQTLKPIEREVQTQSGSWHVRRITPYHTRDNRIEGVVITFADVTERKNAAAALEEAKRRADLANAAKLGFLAAASHDLRQPLQSISLLQGMLAKSIEGEAPKKLIDRLEETLGGMSGILNSLLDTNQLETDTVSPEMVSFSIGEILDRLKDEFTYHAHAKGLALHVIPCSLSIRTDPRLLEQMIRNLLTNALKYTNNGKVLLGCRRHAGTLSIEVWDTGIGLSGEELPAIFTEHHQIGNAARERSRGRGLGLSIVQRLADLLGHRIRVRSRPGKGSVFAIEVMLSARGTAPQLEHNRRGTNDVEDRRAGVILIVEDDPDTREFLELALKGEGHLGATAADGPAALELAARGAVRPDVILADYNLPVGMNGLEVAAKIRANLHQQIPVIILTGDVSVGTLREIALQGCEQLSKPVKLKELAQVVQRLLRISQSATQPGAPHPAEAAAPRLPPVIYVVDDNNRVREEIRALLEGDGRTVEDYASCDAFLEAYRPSREACLVIDAYLPGMNGIELLQRIRDLGHRLPSIMITGGSDVRTAVQAMKAGASDFIEKPIGRGELLAGIDRVLEESRDSSKLSAWRETAADHVAGLTRRQRQIMELVLTGQPSKNIAAALGISQRTVENHRAAVMKRTGVKSLPALARLALAATSNGAGDGREANSR